MTVDSILSSQLEEHYGRFNIIIQVDGIFYEIPFLTLNNDKVIQREFNLPELCSFITDKDNDLFEELRSIFLINARHFRPILERCKIEQSKLSYK